MGIINNFPSGNTDLSVVTATADDIRKNKKILGSDGNIITGNLVTRSTNDIVISPGSVHINPGIYSGQSGFDKSIPNWPITGTTFSSYSPSYNSMSILSYDIELPTIGGFNAISKITLHTGNRSVKYWYIAKIENLLPYVEQALLSTSFIDVIPIIMGNNSILYYDTWCWGVGTSYPGSNNKGLFLSAEIRDTSLHIELSIPNADEGFIYNYGGRATIMDYYFISGASYYNSLQIITRQYT